MATDPTTLPTIADIQQTKKDMEDITEFNASESNTFIDNYSRTRKTMTGVVSEVDNRISEKIAEIDETIIEMQKSRGFRVVGTFADGFTYELFNDVGIDADGNSWIYVGAGAPNKVVAAGTVPSVGAGYEQVTFNSASGVINSNGDSVQDFIDSFALKIFQSPTDGGLTEIQTRTVDANEVYEVRKTSDNSLATIYSKAAGTTEIVQNGTDNKSGSDGVVTFYIPDGSYYVVSGGVQSRFKVEDGIYSVQSMKMDDTLYKGKKVSTGNTTWLVTNNSSVKNVLLDNGLYAQPLNGVWVDDWGVDNTGFNDIDSVLDEIILLKRAILLGEGTYKISTTKQLVSGNTIKGISENTAIDARMTDVLFKFPSGSGRNVKVFSNFHVISTGNAMTNGVVFLLPGVASGAAVQYTSGYKFENIEVGGGGYFGCIWDVSDSFRLTIRDCGYSFVSNPVRLRGSVVQCTIDNLTGNNEGYTRTYDGQNSGCYMEVKTYSDGVKLPENVKLLNCGFVVHNVGIRHIGLAITIQNCDLDYIRDIGTLYGGGDGHRITGGYIAHSNTDVEFIGSLVQKTKSTEDVTIKGVTYSTYSVIASKQTAIQIGDGDSSPFSEPSGVKVLANKIVGFPASWDFGIQADRTAQVNVSDNNVNTSVIKAGGKAINLSYSRNTTCNNNNCDGQEIYISAPVVTSVVTAINNDATVVTQFMAAPASNYEIARNME